MAFAHKRRWLLIIIWLVVFINLLYFGFSHLKFKDRLIQKYLVSYIEQATGGDLHLGNLTLSEKFVMIEKLKLSLPDNEIEFSAESIHIEYDFRRLLWKRIQNMPYVENIYINKPNLVFKLDFTKPANSGKQKKNPPLPNLRKYFKKLALTEGEIHFDLDAGPYKMSEYFSELNGEMTTDKGVAAFLAGRTDNDASIEAEIDLTGGWLNSLSTRTRGYMPMSMYIIAIDSLITEADINFTYSPEMMTLDASMKDIHLEVAGITIKADSLDLLGDSRKIDFVISEPYVNGNKVEASGTLFETFSSNIGVDASVSGKDVDLTAFQDFLIGTSDLSARMTGKFTNFNIDAFAKSDSLKIFDNVIRELRLAAKVSRSDISFQVQNLNWLGNDITSQGLLGYDGSFLLTASSDSLSYNISDLTISGRLEGQYNNRKKEQAALNIQDIRIAYQKLILDNLYLKANYLPPMINLSLNRTHNDLALSAGYDTDNDSLSAVLSFQRFQLNNLADNFTLPSLSGAVSIFADKYIRHLQADLRFYDRYFGNFDGNIQAVAEIDYSQKKSMLNIKTNRARYNYQNLSVELNASGNLDSLQTNILKINENIDVQATLFANPKPAFALNIKEKAIKIDDFIKYFTDQNQSQSLSGFIDLNLQADSRNNGSFLADIQAYDINFTHLNQLSLDFSCLGDADRIEISQAQIRQNDTVIGNLTGSFSLFSPTWLDVRLSMPDISFQSFLKQGMDGRAEIELDCYWRDNVPRFHLKADASNMMINKLTIDKLKLDLLQTEEILMINDLIIATDKADSLYAAGAIGYNLLNSRTFPSASKIDLAFKGNLLNIAAQTADYIKKADSYAEITAQISMSEDGIDINQAKGKLNKGYILLKDQQNRFTHINFDFSISDNIFQFNDFSLKIGNGRLYIDNSIGNNEQDILLNRLNFGQILVSTSALGIDFDLPQYTIEKTMTNLLIKGRNSHYLKIFYDNDAPKISGDIIVNKADIIYPPRTQGLGDYVNTITSQILKPAGASKIKPAQMVAPENDGVYDKIIIPVSLDLAVYIGNQVRYVTYPFEITIDPASYINLVSDEDGLRSPQLDLVSSAGSLILLGTDLQVEKIYLRYAHQYDEIILDGLFSKKTADGTMIQVQVSSDNAGSFPDNLQFNILSDNALDITDADKLFRLRYGRSLSEMPHQNRSRVFRDDLVQTAGLEIENMLLDPMINRFEQIVSRFLNIDYFQMETSFIYNLLSRDSELYGLEEDPVRQYSSDILLENLTLRAGKYLLRDIFLNYEITFQKSSQDYIKDRVSIIQKISLRYKLPGDIKFFYEFSLDEYKQNSHEYRFTKALSFRDINQLYFRILYPYTWQTKSRERYRD
jgi:hypothetical protein